VGDAAPAVLAQDKSARRWSSAGYPLQTAGPTGWPRCRVLPSPRPSIDPWR